MKNQSKVKVTVDDKDLMLAYLAFENEDLKRQVKNVKAKGSLMTIIAGVSLYMAVKAYKKLDNIVTRDEVRDDYNKRNE